MALPPPALARTRALVSRRRRIGLPRRSLSSASATPEHDDDAAPAPTLSPVQTSLALSVHFRHPDLGMRDYEILSRATAFLLQVDPPDPAEGALSIPPPSGEGEAPSRHDAKQGHAQKSAFPHLRENRAVRNALLRRQDYKYDPAGGPPRHAHQLNWLEFLPAAFRPKVHVVSSSHVISPWMWPRYYGQDWLKVVTQEHVRYSLEVWGTSSGGKSDKRDGEAIRHEGKLHGSYEPLAKFALSPYPIHHPKEMDVAVIHLKDEDDALKHITDLGVRPLHLPTMHELETSADPVFRPGERVLFQGFEVYEANATDRETLSDAESNKSDAAVDDERIFHPYSALGTLTLASPDRFLARTGGGSLPEGLCGGPVIKLPNETNEDAPLTIRGVVEGIVPPNHENPQLAGLASFLPSYRMREFVDFAERVMLEHIIDPELFTRVVDMKEKKQRRGTTYETGRGDEVRERNDATRLEGDDDEGSPDDPGVRVGMEGIAEESDTPQLDQEYQDIVASLREHHTPEEVDAILATVEREQEEVVKIMETKGGDMDDVIEDVRRRTYEEKDRIMREIEKEMTGQTNVEEGEIIASKDDKTT
ncbi:hypothetical protein ACHAXT_008232 [Thalassiosira profunda]